MDMTSKIRRLGRRGKKSAREISRMTGLSRNTVAKWLHPGDGVRSRKENKSAIFPRECWVWTFFLLCARVVIIHLCYVPYVLNRVSTGGGQDQSAVAERMRRGVQCRPPLNVRSIASKQMRFP